MLKICVILTIFIGSHFLPMVTYALVSSNGMGGGAWSAAPSWDVGIPVCGDSILIEIGDVVTIGAQQDYSACGSPMVLTINGILRFPGNGPKLRLPAGSTIIVNVGGLISAPGGGNGNKISIGGSWVWEKKDGDVPGYRCFGGCSLLPVEFLNVQAELKEKNVHISWMTLTESNNNYFTVERSSDGITFNDIDKVKGSGMSNSIREYQSVDSEPLEGLSYYRVKQTDFDGQFAYSEIVVVNIEIRVVPKAHLYPNPVIRSENIKVSVPGVVLDQTVIVEVRNINGKIEHIQNFIAIEDGTTLLALSTAGRLDQGLYFISVLNSGTVETNMLLIK